MANQLTIRISVESGNQTVSKVAVAEADEITIHNDATAPVNVKFDAGTPLCDNNNPLATIDIAAGTKREFMICDGAGGLQYRYTATVSGTTAGSQALVIEGGPQVAGEVDNPIVYPEGEQCPEQDPCPKDEINPIVYPEFWIGVIAGAVVTFGAMRLFGGKFKQAQK
jgi:hypothetical protein